MTSWLVIFRAFLFIFFVPPTLSLKKIPVNQLIKKSGPINSYHSFCWIIPILYLHNVDLFDIEHMHAGVWC